jgi:peptidoglycan hydrolase-like protein with peptidoglycan-binding domain
VQPGTQSIATIGGGAIDLASVYLIAALAPAGAVVVLAEDEVAAAGTGLATGVGALVDIPQGITVIRDAKAEVAQFLDRDLLRPGAALRATLAARPRLEAAGLLLPGLAFIPAGEAPQPPVDAIAAAEARDWAAARRVDTAAAYDAFLAAWPSGQNAAAARAARDRVAVTPATTEAALGLSRDTRRGVQQALTDLGFNTRGVDGIFGAGTRAAISAWQRRAGHAATGYLAAGQVPALLAEADRARATRDADDRAYWRSTGALGDEAGLRSYLGRYPNGIYAGTARQGLATIEAERVSAAEASAWNRARRVDTVAAYDTYLGAHPDGAHAAEAQDRIAELQGLTGGRQERAAWDRAQRADTIGAYQAYLADWPRGVHARAARDRIAELTAEQTPADADDARWAIAERQNTAAGYMAYLSQFPGGRHAAEALRRVLQLR